MKAFYESYESTHLFSKIGIDLPLKVEVGLQALEEGEQLPPTFYAKEIIQLVYLIYVRYRKGKKLRIEVELSNKTLNEIFYFYKYFIMMYMKKFKDKPMNGMRYKEGVLEFL